MAKIGKTNKQKRKVGDITEVKNGSVKRKVSTVVIYSVKSGKGLYNF